MLCNIILNISQRSHAIYCWKRGILVSNQVIFTLVEAPLASESDSELCGSGVKLPIELSKNTNTHKYIHIYLTTY